MKEYEGVYYFNNTGKPVVGRGFEEGGREIPEPMELCHEIVNRCLKNVGNGVGEDLFRNLYFIFKELFIYFHWKGKFTERETDRKVIYLLVHSLSSLNGGI